MAALTDTDAPEPIGAAPINFVNRTFVAAAQPFWAEVSGKVETLRAEWSAALKSITAAPTSLTSAGIVTVVTADTFEIALTGDYWMGAAVTPPVRPAAALTARTAPAWSAARG